MGKGATYTTNPGVWGLPGPAPAPSACPAGPVRPFTRPAYLPFASVHVHLERPQAGGNGRRRAGKPANGGVCLQTGRLGSPLPRPEGVG
jgi:hypothetical protein